MAPSLEPPQRPINLIESADKCEQHLNWLMKYASDSKANHNSGKKRVLLEDVITRVHSNIYSLKTWTIAITKGRQTSDEEIKASVKAVFENIVSRVDDAREALSHRLGFSLWTSDKSKASEVARLWKELDEIRDTIGYLHNQVKTVLRDTPDQKERQTRISEVVQRRSKLYYVFVSAIGQMSEAERRSIRFGTYRLLWEQFPPRLDLNGNVGNADDPGDGKVYDQGSIQQTSQILKTFYDAWSEATIKANGADPASPDTLRMVGKLSGMAKICLILRGMKQERLLDCFCEESKDDRDLPLKVETVRNFFEPDDADHAETFTTEQYRAVCRTWNDGEHIKIVEEEPLPLKYMSAFGLGSYGSVTRNQHAFTDAFYACKEQISDEARAHLLREIARLKKLGHRHIVQFVKSYQRGNRYGILLKPAATTDLKKLLDRYRRNGLNYTTDSQDRPRDRVVLKPVLLTAFGCLSRGLAHIHGCHISHNSIKPANILYEKALGPSPARFLWADFGLAHDFGNSGNSKTTSKSHHRYSPRYAAPEIMEEFEARKARGEVEYDDSDDDEGELAPEQSNGGPGNAIGHGRSSDIYSFGIVFLEVLSSLIAEGPEPSIPGDFENCMPFWKNIEGLQIWAKNQIQRLPPKDPLVLLFRLSSKMIAYRPEDRPIISDIVGALTEANQQYFCASCLNQPEEPTSQAVMAEEQMVEGLESAKFLSKSQHHVDGQDHASVHEVEEAPPLAEELPEYISGDDTDTVSVMSSYQPSVSSIGTTRTWFSSNSSLDSIPTTQTTVIELKATFAADEQFSSLCRTALASRGIDVPRFERNLCRLIKQFATGLRKEVATDDRVGRAVAGAINSIARQLAMEIIRTFTSKDTIKKEIDQAKASEGDRHRELELLLAAYQPNHAPTDELDIADDISSDDDVDDVKDVKDEDEDLSNILQLKAFVLSSKAFSNMRWSLYRYLQPDVLRIISKEMRLELDSHTQGQHTVTFHVQWNLLKFCEQELGGDWDLATVLTVTGTGKIAFASTCQEYVVRHWPDTGQGVLTFLKSAIGQRTHQLQLSPELCISMDLSAWHSPIKDEFAIVRASGSQKDLIHIAQQLAWISAVFRVPKYGDLTYSDVVFEKTEPLNFRLVLMDLQKVRNTDRLCWHSLFVNSVIARGFPTPVREKEIGIEIPFEVMISLACILYPMEYQGGTILRGIKLTLVPTAHCSGSVQWHCVSDEQDSYLPRANEVMKQISEWFKTSDFELLRTARTFLGYCKVAEVHLGTSDPDYKSIEKSDAESERKGPRISREVSASLGVSAKGIITANLSPKITFSRGLRATTNKIDLYFHDRILRARERPSIIYDVEKQQGWLVPELSVVLHIAHSWVSRQPDLAAEVLKEIPHAAVSGDGGAAAWDAILKGQAVELRKDSIDGRPQLFGDVIKNILAALESRIDSALAKDDVFMNLPWGKRSRLRGWEFIDLVRWKYSVDRKEVDIDRKTAGEWESIATENPDLVVLFCKGLGQPIRPAKDQGICRLWTPIPEGRCYLTASVPCLKTLSEDCGGTETHPKLTRRFHWHRPHGSRLFESCNYGAENGCTRLQELVVEKKAITPGPLEPHGAVIFGKSEKTMTTGCEPFEAPNRDGIDESTAICRVSHQVEEPVVDAPGVLLGPLSPMQNRERHVPSSHTGSHRRTSPNGTSENNDPNVMSSLVNGVRALPVRPKYDDLRKARRFDTPSQ